MESERARRCAPRAISRDARGLAWWLFTNVPGPVLVLEVGAVHTAYCHRGLRRCSRIHKRAAAMPRLAWERGCTTSDYLARFGLTNASREKGPNAGPPCGRARTAGVLRSRPAAQLGCMSLQPHLATELVRRSEPALHCLARLVCEL